MATQTTIFRSYKSALPCFAGFAILSLCVNALDAAAAQFSHVLCALTGELFKILPSIMLAALQGVRDLCARSRAVSSDLPHVRLRLATFPFRVSRGVALFHYACKHIRIS